MSSGGLFANPTDIIRFETMPRATGLPESVVYLMSAPLEITLDNLAAYLAASGLIEPDEVIDARELGGGISNVVLQYSHSRGCAVLKQSRERIRVADEWLCDQRRTLHERDCIVLLNEILPAGAVPGLVASDDANFLFVMTCAPSGAVLWKDMLFDGLIQPEVAEQTGNLMGRIHRQTAGNIDLERRFTDPELLEQVRIEPYYETTSLREPEVSDEIMAGADAMRSARISLVHGDFVPKNIFWTGRSIFLVDFEIVHYGHPAYDLASCLNHLLLKAWAMPAHRKALTDAAQRLLDAHLSAIRGSALADIEPETIRQLGCLHLARLSGKSPVEYLGDPAGRASARSFAFALLRGEIDSVRQGIRLVADAR